MARRTNPFGISEQDRGNGDWRLRWRQLEEQPDGTRKRVQASIVVSIADKSKTIAAIEEALRTKGWWAPPEAPARPVDANLEMVALAWLRWKIGTRGVAPNTRKNLAANMKRWFRGLREELGLRPDQVVPGSAMTTTNVANVAARWRKQHADSTLYQTLKSVADMWTWAGDEEEFATSIPRPPRRMERILPPAPHFEAPEITPTFAECDAVIRRIPQPVPRLLAIIMRYTGLRLEQAAWVYREDLDFDGCTLVVRKGKSRREKALLRRVEASAHLFADLGEEIRARPPGPLVPDAKARDEAGRPLPVVGYRNHTRYVTRAWKAAVEAKEARDGTWNPPNREQARPDHAFRAAIQGALDAHGVSERILDHLVGHKPKSTRSKHYVVPAVEQQRRAVDLIPPIDWRDVRDPGNVIRLDPRWRKLA